MTDVSNLDDLANAIATSSAKIRNYAKAQAAATQAQELDIQQALSEPGPQGEQGEPGLQGPAGASGGGLTLASATAVGDSQITLDTTGMAVGGYVVIDPYRDCEVRKITAIAGNVVTLKTVKVVTNARLQFVAATREIRVSRTVTSLSGDGTRISVTFDTNHPFAVGDSVEIHTSDVYNGAYSVEAVEPNKITALSPKTGASSGVAFAQKAGDPTLNTFFKNYKLKVTGSNSNNGTYTVSSVYRYGCDGKKTTYLSSYYGFTVSEPIADESGATVTLTVALGAHPAGTPVLYMTDAVIDPQWYGLKCDSLTSSATQNTKALNSALNDAYSQMAGGTVILPVPGFYVNDEIWVEKAITLRGANPDSSGMLATNNGYWANGFPSCETAVLHARSDGDPCKFYSAGASPRQWLEGFVVNGTSIVSSSGSDGATNGNTFTASAAWTSADIGKTLVFNSPTGTIDGDIRVITGASSGSLTFDGPPIPVATGLVWKAGGANGILASQQQPAKWRDLRVNNCLGYGICLNDVQQHVMHNIQIMACGAGLYYRKVEFCWVYGLDIEQTFGVFFKSVATIDGTTFGNNNLFLGVHYEDGGGANVGFAIDGGSNWWIGDAWFSNRPRRGAFLRANGSTYTLQNITCAGNHQDFKIVDDARLGWSINNDPSTGLPSRLLSYLSTTGENAGALSPYGNPHFLLPGKAGRELSIGAGLYGPNGSSNLAMFYAKAGGASDNLLRFLDAAGAEAFKVSGNGALELMNAATIRSGSGAPSNALGVDGDFYFRTDTPGTANQRLYARSAGSYVGVT